MIFSPCPVTDRRPRERFRRFSTMALAKKFLTKSIFFAVLCAAGQASGQASGQAAMPYEIPRETLIPGTPGMPGGYHLMLNGFAHLQNTGLGGHVIQNGPVRAWNGGTTYPLLTDTWAMGYGRDASG